MGPESFHRWQNSLTAENLPLEKNSKSRASSLFPIWAAWDGSGLLWVYRLSMSKHRGGGGVCEQRLGLPRVSQPVPAGPSWLQWPHHRTQLSPSAEAGALCPEHLTSTFKRCFLLLSMPYWARNTQPPPRIIPISIREEVWGRKMFCLSKRSPFGFASEFC